MLLLIPHTSSGRIFLELQGSLPEPVRDRDTFSSQHVWESYHDLSKVIHAGRVGCDVDYHPGLSCSSSVKSVAHHLFRGRKIIVQAVNSTDVHRLDPVISTDDYLDLPLKELSPNLLLPVFVHTGVKGSTRDVCSKELFIKALACDLLFTQTRSRKG